MRSALHDIDAILEELLMRVDDARKFPAVVAACQELLQRKAEARTRHHDKWGEEESAAEEAEYTRNVEPIEDWHSDMVSLAELIWCRVKHGYHCEEADDDTGGCAELSWEVHDDALEGGYENSVQRRDGAIRAERAVRKRMRGAPWPWEAPKREEM